MDFSMFEDLNDISQVMRNVNGDAGMNNRGGDPGAGMGRNTDSMFPPNTPLAMAYVPFQKWNGTYSNEQGFETGTVFPELDLPFKAWEVSE